MPIIKWILLLGFLCCSYMGYVQCPDEKQVREKIDDISVSTDSTKMLHALLQLVDEVRPCSAAQPMTFAFLLRRVSTLFHRAQDPVSALHFYRGYINLVQRYAQKAEEKEQLVGAYYWLSLLYQSMNMRNEQRKALDSCEVLGDELGIVNRSNLNAVYAKVEYFFNIGDYYRSMDYAVKCVALAGKYANHKNPAEAKAAKEYRFGSILWHVNALMLLKNFQAAEKLLQDKLEECSREGLYRYRGTIYEQLAELELQKNNPSRAIAFFQQAIRLEAAAGRNFNSKQILNVLATRVYFRFLKDPDRALEHYNKALRYTNRDRDLLHEDRLEQMHIYGNMANCYVALGDWDAAFAYFKKAFHQLQPGVQEQYIAGIPDSVLQRIPKVQYLVNLVIDKGDAFQKRFACMGKAQDLEEAIRIYRIAEEFLDRINYTQSDLNSKLFWRADTRRLYEQAIKACYLQHNPDAAFYFFEKSRAVLLQDQLQEQSLFTQQQLLRQAVLRKRIKQLESETAALSQASADFAGLQTALIDQQKELDRLQQSARKKNPFLFHGNDIYSIEKVQQHISGSRQTLIEMFAGDSTVYLFYLDKNKSLLRSIDRGSYEKLVAAFLRFCSDKEATNSRFGEFKQVAHALYRLLFSDLPVTDRLLFSPDGSFFPVEALVKNADGRHPVYVMEQHSITYTYSASFLLNSYQLKKPEHGKLFLGMAPVSYPSDQNLAVLDHSDGSVKALGRSFRSASVYTAGQATKKNFLKEFHQYSIIQLYTHGEGSSDAGEPRIFFADAPLSLSELVVERPAATRFIFLSACETAKGKLNQGEGIFNFNRGFAALGIPSSVSMLWQVENHATYELTELFYRFIADGLAKDEALKKAKLAWYQSASGEKKFPYYWAAAVLMGNEAPLVERKKSFPDWAGLLLLLTGAGLLVFLVKKSNV